MVPGHPQVPLASMIGSLTEQWSDSSEDCDEYSLEEFDFAKLDGWLQSAREEIAEVTEWLDTFENAAEIRPFLRSYFKNVVKLETWSRRVQNALKQRRVQ